MRKKYFIPLERPRLGSRKDSPITYSRFQQRLGSDENSKILPLEDSHYAFCKLACRVYVLSWV